MPEHVLDACFVEDLHTAGLLAASCMNLDRAMIGSIAASAGSGLAESSANAASLRSHCRNAHLSPAGAIRPAAKRPGDVLA